MTTRSSDIARDFELGTINELPVVTLDIIYEGSAVGLNSSGYARPLVAGDPFQGFAESQADNSAGLDGAINVRVRTSGVVKAAIASVSIKDIGKTVYMSDDDTFTLVRGACNSRIGRVERYVSSGYAMVAFDIEGLDDGVDGNPLVSNFRQGLGDAPSTTQKYALGTRMRKPDGREFVYAKAGATLNPDMGAKSYNTQHIAYATIAAAAAAGAVEVVLDVAASDGDAGNGAIAANELAGGYIVIFPHSSNTFVRQIVSNTAVPAGGGECTIALDDPIPAALVADSDHGEAMASPYLDVRNTTEATSSVVGVPTWPATVGQYLWLQVKGITWIAPQAEVSVGTNNRQIVFRHDGSIDEHDYSDANVAKGQHAGYVVQNAAGGGQGAPFIMLDI